jgi:tetratricopeptide (TPR) repeat protein|tara:strand:- start:79 stop:513 length:435 start_codon:yes stop_codon:yes gene_type:complete
MIKKLAILFIICFGINSLTNASENNFFEEGKKLFDKENYEDSKFLFQRSIVYDPKHANSYLYLGKIFKIEKNAKEEEKNINTALLLDPRNEEAMYILIDLELERSNFSKVEDLKKDFKKICSTLCEKITSIDTRLKDFEKKDAS